MNDNMVFEYYLSGNFKKFAKKTQNDIQKIQNDIHNILYPCAVHDGTFLTSHNMVTYITSEIQKIPIFWMLANPASGHFDYSSTLVGIFEDL